MRKLKPYTYVLLHLFAERADLPTQRRGISFATYHPLLPMPSFPIYTLGYAQWSIDDVESVVDEYDAILADVRRSPHTTKPGFTRSELDARFENRYLHVPAFGNDNYKEGPVQLVDPEQGLAELRTVDRPPILMCGCQLPEHCHRSVVAALLADRLGNPVEHLRSPAERPQLYLFGNDMFS